jgi:hypothetical protein
MKYRIGLKLIARLFYKLLSMVSNIEIDVLRPDVQLLEDIEDQPRRQYRVNWVDLPRNLPAQVIQILKTRSACLRVHRIRKVGYALLDAQTRMGTA